jgi:hypothetical protein
MQYQQLSSMVKGMSKLGDFFIILLQNLKDQKYSNNELEITSWTPIFIEILKSVEKVYLYAQAISYKEVYIFGVMGKN